MDFEDAPICQTWESVTSQIVDWWFRTPTVRCGCGVRDNDSRTIFSRVALPLLLFLAGLALRLTTQKEGPKADRPEDAREVGDVRKPRSERLWYLDYARIVCVACTVTEHSGGESFSDRNVCWVQQWVVPFLYVVSGMAFMFAKSKLWVYELRLLAVWAVGTGANWVADIASGRDWQSNPMNTTFQMAYVLVLMTLSLLLAPLKKALVWRRQNPTAPAPTWIRAITLLWVLLTAVPAGYFLIGGHFGSLESMTATRGTGLESVVYEGPLFFARCFALFLLAHLSAMWGVSPWAVWILMGATYLSHILVPFGKGGHPLNCELFLIGMVAVEWPMKGKEKVAHFLRELSLPILLFMLIMSMPQVSGRCDLHPLNSWWERLRYRINESILIAGMVTGAFQTGDTYGVTRWLNQWALYAYCFHVAWARMLPVPWGCLLTYSSVFIFFGIDLCRRRKRREETESPAGSSSNSP